MKIKRAAQIFLPALCLALLNFGCEPASLKKANRSETNAANSSSAAPETDAAANLEADLQTMRNADFDFVYVFRRRDGGAFDGEDKKFLRANSPAATNRFILSEGNRAVIAGSSFRFEPQNLEKLQERFAIENFSKPESQTENADNKDAPKKNSNQPAQNAVNR